MLPSIIKIGIPTGIQATLFAISNLAIQTKINIFGEDAMADVAAVGTINSFFYADSRLQSASMTFAGQNWTGSQERVNKAVKSACHGYELWPG